MHRDQVAPQNGIVCFASFSSFQLCRWTLHYATEAILVALERLSYNLVRPLENLSHSMAGMNQSMAGMNQSMAGMTQSMTGMTQSMTGMTQSMESLNVLMVKIDNKLSPQKSKSRSSSEGDGRSVDMSITSISSRFSTNSNLLSMHSGSSGSDSGPMVQEEASRSSPAAAALGEL